MIVVHAGHRIDSTRQGAPRFPADRVGSVYRRVYLHLLDRRPAAVVSAAANGADLIVLRAAEDLFIPFHVTLPLPVDAFRSRSVDDRGDDWREAFDRALRNAESVRVADGLGDVADWFVQGNDFILDTAGRLETQHANGGRRVEALTVVSRVNGAASTSADFASKASARGWPVHNIDPQID